MFEAIAARGRRAGEYARASQLWRLSFVRKGRAFYCQLRIDSRQPRQRPRIRPIVLSAGSLRSSAPCAHAPRSPRVPVRSAIGSPRAKCVPVFEGDAAAACFRTPLASLSESCPLSVPAALPPLRLAGSANSIDRPGPPDRQLVFGELPNLSRRSGANLLHCRSPLSLVLRARR
jgi:hypothetical protein